MLNNYNKVYVCKHSLINLGFEQELNILLPNSPDLIVLLKNVDGELPDSWVDLIQRANKKLIKCNPLVQQQ